MPEALKLDSIRAGYGATVVLEDVGFSLEERQALAVPCNPGRELRREGAARRAPVR